MTAASDENLTPDSELLEESYPESPVPRDKYLVKGELPFTAFEYGVGSMDLRVFEQDIYWVNRENQPFVLNEMDREQLLEVLNFVFTHVEYIYGGIVEREWRWLSLDIHYDREPVLSSEEDSEARVLARLGSANPVEWLNSTPLVKRIQLLLDRE